MIYGNTIVNAGAGIYIHNDVTKNISGVYEPQYTLTIANNTIYNPIGKISDNSRDGRGIWSFNSSVQTQLSNNLIVLGYLCCSLRAVHAG